jgi:hypothetical protein
MKFKKILIVAMMVSSLFLVSIATVEAADVPIVIVDEDDDVYDTLGNDTTNDYPNIDIVKVEYERDGTQVTVTLTVKGIIEDLGSLEGEELGDIVSYGVSLETSDDTYMIGYVNQSCFIQTSQLFENLTDFSVDESVLVAHFEVNNTDETFVALSAETIYMVLDFVIQDYNYLFDSASTDPLEITTADIPGVGSTGETVQFKVFPDYGQPEYEYLWEFGDGATSTEKNPTHTYTKAGTYNCTVTVTDQVDTSVSYSGAVTIVTEGGGETGTPILLLLAVIIIIVVIGIVVIVWIIRR